MHCVSLYCAATVGTLVSAQGVKLKDVTFSGNEISAIVNSSCIVYWVSCMIIYRVSGCSVTRVGFCEIMCCCAGKFCSGFPDYIVALLATLSIR